MSRKSARAALVPAIAAVMSIAMIGASCSRRGPMQATAALDVPIEFHGRILDQEGKAVPGVRVTCSVRGFDPLGKFFMGHTKYEFESDSSGRFSLRGARGNGLSLNLEKAGHELDRSSHHDLGFIYGQGPIDHKPNARSLSSS